METQFNLSEKIKTDLVDYTGQSLGLSDVKEFIRLLKEGMPNQDITEAKAQEDFIDKLAGEKLV